MRGQNHKNIALTSSLVLLGWKGMLTRNSRGEEFIGGQKQIKKKKKEMIRLLKLFFVKRSTDFSGFIKSYAK